MAGPITIALATSPYPPSFDNNPIVFGWALFARLLIFMLASATLVRLRSRSLADRLPANHPVYYHRMVTTCFLWSAFCGSLSDVLAYVFWGEVSDTATAAILLVSRLLDALTMVPFLMALFVPFWLRWMAVVGIVKSQSSITLNGVVHDLKVVWPSVHLPFRLLVLSATASALISAGKYVLWVGHARG